MQVPSGDGANATEQLLRNVFGFICNTNKKGQGNEKREMEKKNLKFLLLH